MNQSGEIAKVTGMFGFVGFSLSYIWINLFMWFNLPVYILGRVLFEKVFFIDGMSVYFNLEIQVGDKLGFLLQANLYILSTFIKLLL